MKNLKGDNRGTPSKPPLGMKDKGFKSAMASKTDKPSKLADSKAMKMKKR